MIYDIFNGDADGLCALTQLRLAKPETSTLITGVKRNIALLEKITAQANDKITVLDISMDKNQQGLLQALKSGAQVFYVDHHFPGEIPVHDNLSTLINTEPEICTSILVDQHLNGQFREWAIVGAFGDNLSSAAEQLASRLENAPRLAELKQLGIYLNYNGYGSSIEDLHFKPDQLFTKLVKFTDPLDFIDEDRSTFLQLETGYQQDMSAADKLSPYVEKMHIAVFMLPDKAWARRVSGVFGNDLANKYPERGHAIITERADGDFLVSIRAPLANRSGADEICRQFPTGGGRKAAAGINQLEKKQLDKFIRIFSDYYER